MKISKQGIIANAKHVAGMAVGLVMRHTTSYRYSKVQRGKRWFSTVAANLVADREIVELFPFKVVVTKP
jgi:hypothetical protein